MKKLFLICIASFLMFACTKEGAPGPMGPAGPAGKNANVSTYYTTIFPSEWKMFGKFGTPGYYCFVEKDFGALTPEIINNGAVLVYALMNDADNQLPYLMPYNGYIKTLRYDLNNYLIGFIVEDSNFKTEPFQDPIEFKIVVIGN